jgi:hypothetical protein
MEDKKIDLYKINPHLKKELENIVNKFIASEHRKNALGILTKCTEKTVMEFLFFGLSKDGNMACTCLDFAKDKDGNILKNGSFGFNENEI